MKISFYGACGEVTGSNYLIETDSRKIILECGLFQGLEDSEIKNYRDFPYNASEIDAVIISHSHLDHIGLLPKLYANGFVGKIYSTYPTYDFANIFLQDAQKLQEGNLQTKNKHGLIYSLADVLGVIEHFEPKEYYEDFTVVDNIKAKFYDAGHILGSAIVELSIEGKKIVFTGDLGNPPVPILRDTDFIDYADYVIMESTYGKRSHKGIKERSKILESLILDTIKNNGTLLIPSFALERTQQILYEINAMISDKKIPDIPVYLDSPLAIKVTKIYPQYEKYYDKEAKRRIKLGDDILHFPSLKICETVEQSKQIRHQLGPKIVIAGAGMSTGGRILFHERDFLSDSSTTLAVVGFQVKGTLGREIIDGARQVEILGDKINVKAKVVSIDSYSAHGDYNFLTLWLSKIKAVKQVFLIHGEEEARENLSNIINSKLHIKTTLPIEKETIEIK